MKILPLLLALTAACDPGHVEPGVARPPQKITYESGDGAVHVTLETPRWANEPAREWLMRHGTGWLAWEEQDGQALHDLDDEPRAASPEADPGDGLR